MIMMLVGDKNGIDCSDVFADCGEAFSCFAAAQPGIDEDACTIRRNKSRVAGAAAGENADLDDVFPFLIGLFGQV